MRKGSASVFQKGIFSRDHSLKFVLMVIPDLDKPGEIRHQCSQRIRGSERCEKEGGAQTSRHWSSRLKGFRIDLGNKPVQTGGHNREIYCIDLHPRDLWPVRFLRCSGVGFVEVAALKIVPQEKQNFILLTTLWSENQTVPFFLRKKAKKVRQTKKTAKKEKAMGGERMERGSKEKFSTFQAFHYLIQWCKNGRMHWLWPR